MKLNPLFANLGMNEALPSQKSTQKKFNDEKLGWATLAYLGLPQLLFTIFWLSQIAAFLWCGIFGLVCYFWLKNKNGIININNSRSFTPPYFLLSLVLAILSGAGGIVPRNWDWEKHDMILFELVNRSWPVVGDANGVEQVLVYYFPYYLIPAFFGKLLGFTFGLATLALWSAMGIYLTGCWLSRLTGIKGNVAVFLFAIFSAPDILGWLISQGSIPIRVPSDYWSVPALPPIHSQLMTLFWTPQVAFGSWLPAAVAMSAIKNKSGYCLAIICASLGFCWSPLSSLGFLPFGLVMSWSIIRYRPKEGIIYSLALGGLLASVSIAFFYSFKTQIPSGIRDVWQFPLSQLLPRLLLAIFIEWGLWILVAWAVLYREIRCFYGLIICSTVWLCLLTVYDVGVNDLIMKATVPLGFFMGVVAMRVLYIKWSKRTIVSWIIFTLYLIGGLSILQDLHRTFSFQSVTPILPVGSALQPISMDALSPIRVRNQYLTLYTGKRLQGLFNFSGQPKENEP